MRVVIQHYSMVVFTFALLLFHAFLQTSHAAIRFERVPDSGIQPQVASDSAGRFHLLYFKGDPMGGDLFYTVKLPGVKQFPPATRVNTQQGSALVAGTMRGPHMTLGRDHVHVVWMGGNGAAKVKVGGENVTPLLYTRLSSGRDGFEPERNILTQIAGLDGGQTVAADKNGNVYVLWHGAPPGTEGEEERGLYVARSMDDGKTFAKEWRATVSKRGACACCGLRAKVDHDGALHVLFRSAEGGVNRDGLWLKSTDLGQTFLTQLESPWRIATCPASSASLAFSADVAAGAWENEHGVIAKVMKGHNFIDLRPDGGKKQKHPTLAINDRGEILLTWVEDAGWGQKGTLASQLFNATGESITQVTRHRDLPAWSFGAPVAEDGTFVVYY